MYSRKLCLNFLIYEIRFFQTTSFGETIETNVDLKKLETFVVKNFFYLKSSICEKLSLNF
jgi:hypothetical protein